MVIIFIGVLQDKQEQLKQFSGEQVLRGEEFKRYVNKLRGKSSLYKMKRGELSDMRAEFGILSRTEEILKAKDAQLLEQLASAQYVFSLTTHLRNCLLSILIYSFV